MPRYLTVSLLGTVIFLMETSGQICFCSVKVTCVDFFSLILKPHLWNHFSIESRPRWRVDEAVVGLAWDANSAVSGQMLLWLFLLILVSRQCRWRIEGARGHCLGVYPLLLGKLW